MADVSVRPARLDDAPEIARIQLESWRIGYARWLPSTVLAGIDPGQAAARWHAAVSAPPTPRHHVLVAQEQGWRVGFAAFGPADPTGDPAGAPPLVDPAGTGVLHAILVEPRWGRRGHGSRMLAATVELMRADGFGTAVAWVPEQDGATLGLLGSTGWDRDGYARTLQAGGVEIAEVRMHVAIEEGPT
ncbi:MAG: GNAT family N-acetyltransferase [Actinobacteria bacterium]|nr:GNAT family N-acetyltransferase [Actinomycetota bacterium]MBI3688048.1 GNAT family N-acetyltransferase [Actinomycetota bacterium]